MKILQKSAVVGRVCSLTVFLCGFSGRQKLPILADTKSKTDVKVLKDVEVIAIFVYVLFGTCTRMS